MHRSAEDSICRIKTLVYLVTVYKVSNRGGYMVI